ncbi:MAG: 3-deoxy-D-manno-octulosonic acid transferase [Beijerinckiaceae bacterium]
MTRSTLLIGAYRLATAALTPFAPLVLAWRRRSGREDPARARERMGSPAIKRPRGRLAWVHGASVGEGIALLPLIVRLRERGFLVLLTTGTVASAQVLGERLPDGVLHQYAPLDAPRFMRQFLDHWRPDIILLAESELWPNLLLEAQAHNVPVVLVNARMSQRSYERWKRASRSIQALLKPIHLCLAQSVADASRLIDLGAARVQVAGNLKYDVPALPADPQELAELRALIGSRPVWLAASTHDGEERMAMMLHTHLLQRFPDLVTMVAPRHAQRGAEIEREAMKSGLNPVRRSTGAKLPARGPQFYIADTMGEMGLLYRLASIVFLGKSFAGGGGGQNPIEPAKLGAAILHGPDVSNFADVYAEFTRRGGARQVNDEEDFARALTQLLGDARRMREMSRAAGEAVDSLVGACDNIMNAIEPYVLQMQLERH